MGSLGTRCLLPGSLGGPSPVRAASPASGHPGPSLRSPHSHILVHLPPRARRQGLSKHDERLGAAECLQRRELREAEMRSIAVTDGSWEGGVVPMGVQVPLHLGVASPSCHWPGVAPALGWPLGRGLEGAVQRPSLRAPREWARP